MADAQRHTKRNKKDLAFLKGFFLQPSAFFAAPFLAPLPTTHYPNRSKNTSLLLAFNLVTLVGAWRDTKWNKKDLAFFERVFSGPRCFFRRPFARPILDHTTSNLSKKHKSFVGFQVVVLVGAWRCNKRNKKDLVFFVRGFFDCPFFCMRAPVKHNRR